MLLTHKEKKGGTRAARRVSGPSCRRCAAF